MCSPLQTEEDLKKIRKKVTDDVEPANEAITALMDAIEQTNTQHEVRRALDEKRNMDGTTAITIAASLKVYLSDAHRTKCYLPLFNLATTSWSPLRAEMFKQLRDVVPNVVEAVFTKESNPEGVETALDYLITVLGKRGVLEVVDYTWLLKCPLSLPMCINWIGQCNLLAYAPDNIWEDIRMNNEFTERATTDICFTLQFSLMTNQRMCVKRLYQLVVDIKSKQESKGKIVIASQILWQLLQIPEFDPGKEVHRIATTVLVEEIGADPLCRFNAEECAALARELHIQLPEAGGCTITHAIRRGPAFEELSVELFASRWDLHNAPRCLDQLIDEDISDDAFTVFIRRITVTCPNVELGNVMTKCVRKGYVTSIAEIYKFKPGIHHPFILMVIEFTTQSPENQEKYLQLLEKMNPDLYSPQCTLAGENALHIAAAQGYTELAKQILVRGYTNLLWGEDKKHMYPIQRAVKKERFCTAEVLLRSTNDRARTLKLFRRDCGKEPRISLYTLLENLSEQRDKEKAKQLVQFILAVLDVTVSEGHDPELLETDKEGNKSTESGEPSCYDLIAEKRLIAETTLYNMSAFSPDQLAEFYKRQNPGYRGTFLPQGDSGPSPCTSFGSISGVHSTIGTTAQGTTAQVPGMAHHLPQQTDEELSESDMIEISTYVRPMEAANILNLGVVLGLSYIKLKDKMKSETFLLDVIHSWLQKEDQVEKKGKPTWRNLVNALQSKGIGQTGIANQIAKDKG